MKSERENITGNVEKSPFVGQVIEKITETAFSVKKVDRRYLMAKRIANEMGMTEAEAVRELVNKGAKWALYAAFSPLLGKKLTEEVKKSLRRKK